MTSAICLAGTILVRRLRRVNSPLGIRLIIFRPKLFCALRLLALTLLAVLGNGMAASLQAAPIELSTALDEIDLVSNGEYFIDTSGKLTAANIAANTNATWQKSPNRGIYPLLPNQALWLRFNVVDILDDKRWTLEIPYAALDRAELYKLNADGSTSSRQQSGDLIANSAWTRPQRHTVMAIETATEQNTPYLLRIENAQGFSAPIRLVAVSKLLSSEQGLSLFLGTYFGISLLGVLVGIVGLLWLRDSAYLFFMACAALVGLTQAAASGYGGMYLWPNNPYWADRSLATLGSLAVISFFLLNAKIVYIKQRSPRLNSGIWLFAALGLALCVALMVTDSALRIALSMPFVLSAVVLMIGINAWAWRHGDRLGLWILASFIPFFLAIGLAALRYVQWIPLSFFTEQSWLASLALQQAAMLAALIARSQQRRENARRIAGVDQIDPATGLLTDQVFSTRLARMVARSELLKYQSAVMVIEVINSEQILRDFGKKIADEVPLRVASRLLSTAREIDSAARLSELRFGMLIEGPFSAEEAATLGPRIVARCLMPYRGLHIDCVSQVRVAYALVPEPTIDAEPVVERLARLLAAAPKLSKKAVYMLGEAPAPPRRRAHRRAESY